MGFVRNLTYGFTGVSGAEAAERGAELQAAAGQLAVEEQRAAREQITRELAPYREFGAGVLPYIGGTIGQIGQLTQGLPEARLGQLGPLPSVLPSDIGQDSLFQSLKRQAISGIESSAAARGKLMSGTTPQAIAEQVQNLALARSGDIQRQNILARQQLIGERGELYGQELGQRQAMLGERAGLQSTQFQQLFNVGQLGQAAAAQQAANVQGSASNISSLLGQIGSAQSAGGIGAAQAYGQGGQNVTNAAILAYALSDRRVKEDIKRVGKTDDGLPIYTFRYKGKPTVHMGVMAQDVEKKNPDAVKEINGIKAVNYGAL